MKKNYVKPEFEAVELEIESLMNTLSGEQGYVDVDNDCPATDGDPDLVIGRRGSWGNRWE